MSQSGRIPESLGLSRRESPQRGLGQVGFVQGIRHQGIPHRPGMHPRGRQPRGRGDDDDAGGEPVLKSHSMKRSHSVMSGAMEIPYSRPRTRLPGFLVPPSRVHESVVNPTIPPSRPRRLASHDDASPKPPSLRTRLPNARRLFTPTPSPNSLWVLYSIGGAGSIAAKSPQMNSSTKPISLFAKRQKANSHFEPNIIGSGASGAPGVRPEII